MEFNQKLQNLRKQKNLTQDELAEALFVSRTAISKWESGRGYPNIDSLKALSVFFGVTVDDLLSGEELLILSREDQKKKDLLFRDLTFGLLDVACGGLLFFPFFGQPASGAIQSVSLLSLQNLNLSLKIAFFAAVIGMILFGIATLSLQNCSNSFWVRSKSKISLVFNTASAILFVICRHPYAATFLLIFLIIKVFLILKQK